MFFCCACRVVFWSCLYQRDNNNLSFVTVNIYLGSMSIHGFVRLDTHMSLVNSISSLESFSIFVVVDKTIKNKNKNQLVRRMNIDSICLDVWTITILNRYIKTPSWPLSSLLSLLYTKYRWKIGENNTKMMIDRKDRYISVYLNMQRRNKWQIKRNRRTGERMNISIVFLYFYHRLRSYVSECVCMYRDTG